MNILWKTIILTNDLELIYCDVKKNLTMDFALSLILQRLIQNDVVVPYLPLTYIAFGDNGDDPFNTSLTTLKNEVGRVLINPTDVRMIDDKIYIDYSFTNNTASVITIEERGLVSGGNVSINTGTLFSRLIDVNIMPPIPVGATIYGTITLNISIN